jgi:hypothetical protein
VCWTLNSGWRALPLQWRHYSTQSRTDLKDSHVSSVLTRSTYKQPHRHTWINLRIILRPPITFTTWSFSRSHTQSNTMSNMREQYFPGEIWVHASCIVHVHIDDSDGIIGAPDWSHNLSKQPSIDGKLVVARCVQTLTQRKHSVLALAASQKYVFSGSQGGRIYVSTRARFAE